MKTFHMLACVPSNYAKFASHDELRVINECKHCGGRRFERLFPAKIEYLGGQVADFHNAGTTLIARRSVAEELTGRFPGIEVKDVLMHTGVSLWSGSEKRPIMAREYSGPELAELWFPLDVPPNPRLSSLLEVDRCDECGILAYEVMGVERISKVEPSELFRNGFNYHRSPDMGLRIRRSDLGANFAYRFNGGRRQVLEPVRDYILERGFTNADFIDYGEIIDYPPNLVEI